MRMLSFEDFVDKATKDPVEELRKERKEKLINLFTQEEKDNIILKNIPIETIKKYLLNNERDELQK